MKEINEEALTEKVAHAEAAVWRSVQSEEQPNSPTFTIEGIFDIKDRGPVISRSQDESKVAWARGERWKLGQGAVCGDLRARVGGIERFCVPEGHPAHNDGALLLADVSIDDLEVGQVWEGVPE